MWKEHIKKYGLITVIRGYFKHMFQLQFWGWLWWKITPKKIRKYILATAALETYEKKHGIITPEEYEAARKFVEQ